MNRDAYILEAIRTPRGKGKKDGTLHEVKAVDLVTGLMDELTGRLSLDSQEVEDVVLGCVAAIGDQGGNIAKTAALAAGWNNSVPGFTLNRFCASGLEAVNLADMKIRSGRQDLVVAGGVEAMSRVPMGSDGGPWAQDPMTNLTSGFIPQGISADLIATLNKYQRDDIDEFAASSHVKAAAAQKEGKFNRSVVPVVDRNGLTILAKDETIRPDCSGATLAKLNPSFAKIAGFGFDAIAKERYPQVEELRHFHTPGNSSGIVDGASLVLIGTEDKAAQLGIRPRARIVSQAVISEEPTIMLTGPAPATKKALEMANLKPEDIDLYEVNEAFASVVMNFRDELNIPDEKINVNGGAIAMGHPLGATGAMLIGTLIDELEVRDQRYGVVTLCVGGGMGVATVIERV